MGRFNMAEDTSITNYMGGKAFVQSPEEELAFAGLTTFVDDSYYEKKDERLTRIKELVATVDPTFVAKLAVYVRIRHNMRSASHVLLGELSRVHRGDSLVADAIYAATTRVDDLTELVAYLGKPIPNGVKKGIAVALTKFDSYQLGKYRAEGKQFSLVDVFNLIHPIPPLHLRDTWEGLVDGKLTQTGVTWEARLSAGEEPRVVWRELLEQDKLGYMALLRNLRNIAKTNDLELVRLATDRIADRGRVLSSKQLPFRFLSAYQALDSQSRDRPDGGGVVFEKDQDIRNVLIAALNKAIEYSIENIPVFGGRTLILSDNSGSMCGDGGGASLLSARSRRTTADIANLFAVLYWTRMANTSIGLFGDKLIRPTLNRNQSVFENFNLIHKEAEQCGLGTETGIFLAIDALLTQKSKVDRIVIFSDQQVGAGCGWFDTTRKLKGNDFNSLIQRYISLFPDVVVYSIDLKGYGNKLFSHNIKLLSGWSDKIFEIMQLMETDPKALINDINRVELLPPPK